MLSVILASIGAIFMVLGFMLYIGEFFNDRVTLSTKWRDLTIPQWTFIGMAFIGAILFLSMFFFLPKF